MCCLLIDTLSWLYSVNLVNQRRPYYLKKLPPLWSVSSLHSIFNCTGISFVRCLGNPGRCCLLWQQGSVITSFDSLTGVWHHSIPVEVLHVYATIIVWRKMSDKRKCKQSNDYTQLKSVISNNYWANHFMNSFNQYKEVRCTNCQVVLYVMLFVANKILSVATRKLPSFALKLSVSFSYPIWVTMMKWTLSKIRVSYCAEVQKVIEGLCQHNQTCSWKFWLGLAGRLQKRALTRIFHYSPWHSIFQRGNTMVCIGSGYGTRSLTSLRI